MEIRGEKNNKKVRFDSLKEGEAFYYNSELLMKTSAVYDKSTLFSTPPYEDLRGTIYNCVSLRHGRMMTCADDTMVGVARVHIEKEY